MRLTPKGTMAGYTAVAVALLAATLSSCAGGANKKHLVLAGANPKAVRWLKEGLAKEDPDEQEACFRKAVEIDPELAAARNRLGVTLFEKKDFRGAVAQLQAAVRLDATRPGYAYNLGMVYEHVGKTAQAVRLYEDARALDPDDVRFVENLARARLKLGEEDDEVLELLDMIVAREANEEWVRWADEQRIRIRNRRERPRDF